MMTYEQWLDSTLCPDTCHGCRYNIPARAACTYKDGKCYYYDLYRREAKTDNHPTLFD